MAFLTPARILTLALATSGAALFWMLSIPLPFLFGPMVACLLAALFGARLQGLGQVSVAARTILGVAVGSAVTPALVASLPQMAGTLLLVPVYIAVIGLIGMPFFARVCGFDRATAYYAAMPGGFQDMVIFGHEAGGDIRALSLIHATRVLVIVTLAPFLLTQVFGVSLSAPIGAPISEVPVRELALMVGAAIVGWKLGERVGLFGASILGPLLATALLSLTDLIHMRPPAEAIIVAQYFVGLAIGVHYTGITLQEIRRVVLSGMAFMVVLAGIAAGFTEVIVLAGLAPALEGFLAFAPGGQAEMAILAIVTGADLGFVVIHHLARIMLVILCAPLAARALGLIAQTDRKRP